MSAELSVGNVKNKAGKKAPAMVSAHFSVLGGYRYYKVNVETKERPRKDPFFLKVQQWWPPHHKGGVGKSAFRML